MTFAKWSKLYTAYKSSFDLELYLTLSKKRYTDIEKEESIDDIIPF